MKLKPLLLGILAVIPLYASASSDLTSFSFSVEMGSDSVPTLTIEAELSSSYSEANSIGVLYWLVGNDQTWVYPERDTDGVFKLTETLNPYLSSGTYAVRAVRATDNLGAELSLGGNELTSFGYQVTSEFLNPQSDNVKPEVEFFSMSPFAYDSTLEQWQFSYDLSASDDMSGLQSGHIVELVNGSGTSLQEWAYFDDTGITSATRSFEKFIPSDTYTVNTIRIYDNAGNDGWLYTEDLQERGLPYQLELNNTIASDDIVPVLVDFEMISSGKSDTNRPVVQLNYQVEDTGSGYDKSYLRAKDESGVMYDHWVYLDEYGVQTFSFSMNSDFAGLLEVDYFRIYDKAGNSKTYGKEDLDLLGFETSIYIGVPPPTEYQVEIMAQTELYDESTVEGGSVSVMSVSENYQSTYLAEGSSLSLMVQEGTQLSLTTTPDEAYRFARWQMIENGDDYLDYESSGGGQDPLTFSVTRDIKLYAYFESSAESQDLVLYSSETYEVVTPEMVAAGGTSWLSLDPVMYPNYYHPAYYSLDNHFVVQNDAITVFGWAVVDPDTITIPQASTKVLYNTSTHETLTHQDVSSGSTFWVILDPSQHPDYEHPAYYNLMVHQVLDHSPGSQVGTWILTENGEEDDEATGDDHDDHAHDNGSVIQSIAGKTLYDWSRQTWIYFHTDTAYSYNEASWFPYSSTYDVGLDEFTIIESGDGPLKIFSSGGQPVILGPVDLSISSSEIQTILSTAPSVTPDSSTESSNPPTSDQTSFSDPTPIYSEIQNTSLQSVNETMLVDIDNDGDLDIVYESMDGSFFLSENGSPIEDEPIVIFEEEKVLYNTASHATFTKSEVEAGGTGWMLLEEVEYPEYQHPAYYNLTFNQVLESGSGSQVGDWILVDPRTIFEPYAVAPDSISGYRFTFTQDVINIHDQGEGNVFETRETWDQPMVEFTDEYVVRWNEDNQTWGDTSYAYTYLRTSENQATINIWDPSWQWDPMNPSDGGWSISYDLTFRSNDESLMTGSVSQGDGDWYESSGGFITQGPMTFEMYEGVLPPPSEEWDFWVNQTFDGITFGWEDSYTSGYSLILYNGEQNIFYGGHPSEYAEVRFSDFGLSGTEPLEGEFWEYGLNGEFIRATPKFVLFPNFNNQVFRVLIDQHWSGPDNTGTLEGFTLRWNEDRPGSVFSMDMFHPGGGPFPRPNGDPGDDRMFFKKGVSSDDPDKPIEKKIEVTLNHFNLKGNEVLEGQFWELSDPEGSEIANSGIFNIRLSDWTGIPSSAYVPETLEGIKLRITEVYYPDSYHLDYPDYVDSTVDYMAPPVMDYEPLYRERMVTLGQYDYATQQGSALVDGRRTNYTYVKDGNQGILSLNYEVFHDDPFFPWGESLSLEYNLYFDGDDHGHGTFTKFETNDLEYYSGSESGDLVFEVIEYGFPVHSFTYEEINELTGPREDGYNMYMDAQAGPYVLHYSGGPNGESQGYLEPLYNADYSSVYYETPDSEDWLRVDLEKYPEYAPEDFVAQLPMVGYKFYEDSFSLPRKAREYLEMYYRNDDGSPTGYWAEERENMDMMMGTTYVELVAYMDSGIEVVFYPDGTFNYEYNPWGHIVQETDAQLSFNPLASSWGSGGKFSLDNKTNGANPAHVCIKRADTDSSEPGSILYRISLTNEKVGDDMVASLAQHDLANTDLPAGTSLSLTFNYESYDPKYLIVSGAEVVGYRNEFPSWDGEPGSFTILAKTVDPVASVSNPDDSIGSTFGITVQMGGERYYGGTIFETNVIPLDVGPAVISSPWDRVLSFHLNGLSGTSTKVRAFAPESHFNNHFGIYDMYDVKAAIADESGLLSFVAGSRSYAPAPGETEVGSSFQRIPHIGMAYHDPYAMMDPMMSMPMDPNMEAYRLDDSDFGINQAAEAFSGVFDYSSAYNPGDIVIDGAISYIALDAVGPGMDLSDPQYWQPIEESALLEDDFAIDSYVDPMTLMDYGVDYYDPTFSISPDPNAYLDSYDVANPSGYDPYTDPLIGTGLTGDPMLGDADYLLNAGVISDTEYSSMAVDAVATIGPELIAMPDAQRRSAYITGTELLHEMELKSSEFDFDGDGYADFLWEISFEAKVFPGEVQIGDPYVDPLAGVNPDELPVISGVVSDANGEPLQDIGIYIFSAPDGLQGYWEPAVVYDYKYPGNGVFEISVLPGNYYVQAWGHDPMTGQNYRSEVYGTYEAPTLFTMVDKASSPRDVNFLLEEEYTMSYIYANVSSKLDIEGLDAPVSDIYAHLELTPVDPSQNNAKLTDYSVWTLHVNYDGSVNGEAPLGDYLVELSSYGNPMDLNTEVYWSVKEGSNNFDPMVVKVKQSYKVSGVVDNEAGLGVWADVVFLNPEDENDMTWPSWEPMPMDYSIDPLTPESYPEEGSYSVRIPEGTYKIMAMDHSGLYENGYYGGSSFETAQTVTIDDHMDGIDITMPNGSVSTLTLRIENNQSEPISGAWINLYDAYDEYFMFYPQINELSPGDYSLTVPEGTYKVQVSAPDYKSFFMVKEYGNTVWEESFWEAAGTISAMENNSTDLGTAVLEKYEVEEWMLYDMFWLEEEVGEAAEFVGNVIEGTVTTDKGETVPSARIVVRTTDYLITIDHVLSNQDGSFKVENLPDGDWVVFAEPSEEFQEYRQSDENRQSISLLGGATEKDVNLVLQSSNVSGRVMYPENGKTTALADAHIWVFEDMDGDKEPDYNDWFVEEDDSFEEDFAFTDSRGFFSFNLQEGVSYSMKLDLPGKLSALAPEPISFTVTDEKIKIGNAIRLDWKAAGSTAEKFDIKKRIKGSSDSPNSLFDSEDDHLTAGTTSYVDLSVVPGKNYDYLVYEDNKTQPLKDGHLRVSPPVIYLSPPSKSAKGLVINSDTNETVEGALIEAWRTEGEGWASTSSGSTGSYELTLGPGEWEISVYRPYGQPVSWSYDGSPTRVLFKEDSSVESISMDPFIVSEMGGGKVTGSIKAPDGVTTAQLSQYVYIDVYDPMGRGDWGQPDADGKFDVRLQPGEYELTIWVDPSLEGFGSPEGRTLRVGKKNVPVGELELVKLDSKITGTLTTTSDKPLIGVEVWAWSEEGGWASDFTNTSGAYSLDVGPGRWEVGYEIPMATDGSEPPYLPMPPKKVRIRGNNETKELDLKVRDASASVSGVVLAKQDVLDTNGDKNGTKNVPVVDLDAWVYAIELSEDGTPGDGFQNVVAEVPLSQFGTFSFPGFPGSYSVGIWLPPGSDYAEPAEQVYRIEMDGSTPQLFEVNPDDSDDPVDKASFVLTKVTSTLSGSFKDGSEVLNDLVGEVYAMRTDADGWRFAPIETNGTYRMTLPPGEWIIDYYIEEDPQSRGYPSHPQRPERKTIVDASNVLNFDFSKVDKISSTIFGTVVDENGNDLNGSTVYVWAFREGSDNLSEFWNEVETSEDGNFSIPILPGGKYEVGIYLSEELRSAGYLDSGVQEFRLKSTDNLSNVKFKLLKPSEENYISGVVKDESGRALEEAVVYAWTYDGLEAEALTDESGAFKLLVPNGTIWQVGAEYSEINASDAEIFYFSEYELDVDLRASSKVENLEVLLVQPDFTIPDGTSVTFDPSADFVTLLPDGTELMIPGGAANVGSDVESVRLVVTPNAKGLSKDATVKTADYGYSIELFDNKGKKVEGEFKKDVIITIPVDLQAAKDNDLDLDNIEGKYYSSTKNAWESAKTSTWDENSSKLTLTTDHFSDYVVGSTSDLSDLVNNDVSKVKSASNAVVKDWYQSDWFGTFYDAGEGWIFHEKLGWLYTQGDLDRNFWFYHESKGWLWSGSDYYDQSEDEKAFFFQYTDAESDRTWLYYQNDGTFYSYPND